jgi:hypothetical protein
MLWKVCYFNRVTGINLIFEVKERFKVQELKKSTNPYNMEHTDYLTTIRTHRAMKVLSVFWDDERSSLLVAVQVESANGSYQVEYILLDEALKITDVCTESEGVLPSFLAAPDKTVWVRLTSTQTDKIKEIVLPLENRERIREEKLITEFVEDYEVKLGQETVYFSKDIFDMTKKDKMGRYQFDKNHLFKSRKTYQLPLPSHAKALSGEVTLQMVNALYPNRIMHREVEGDGAVSRQREFSLGLDYHHLYPVQLSFDGNSRFFVTTESEMLEVTVDEQGRVVQTQRLIQLHEVGEMFYNVWEPVLLNDAYVVRFNYQDGNGYIMIKQGKAMECWLKKHEESVYTDRLSNRVIELESCSLMLTHLQKISDQKCALIYSRVSVESLDEAFKIGILSVSDHLVQLP